MRRAARNLSLGAKRSRRGVGQDKSAESKGRVTPINHNLKLTMTYQLHDNIPAPEAKKAGRPQRAAKYPFADMQPGQSFFEAVTPAEGQDVAAAQRDVIDRLRSAAARWKKSTGHKSRTFRVDVHAGSAGEPLVGCWRVA